MVKQQLFKPIKLLTLMERGYWMLLESGGGGRNQPPPSRSPKNTVKIPQKKYFLKVYNELGKVMKFRTSRLFFHGEISEKRIFYQKSYIFAKSCLVWIFRFNILKLIVQNGFKTIDKSLTTLFSFEFVQGYCA